MKRHEYEKILKGYEKSIHKDDKIQYKHLEIPTCYEPTPLWRFSTAIQELSIFGSMKNMSILDVGCGYGLMLKHFRRVFHRTAGIEKNKYLVQLAEKMDIPNVYCINAYSSKAAAIIRSFNVLYTFNITLDLEYKELIFNRILNNMKKDQILIEVFDDYHLIIKMAEEKKFKYISNHKLITIISK